MMSSLKGGLKIKIIWSQIQHVLLREKKHHLISYYHRDLSVMINVAMEDLRSGSSFKDEIKPR